MSVLVEALSLVVPRKVLDVSYPGGTDAWLHHMCEPSVPARLVCADDTLTSVSFLHPDDTMTVQDELQALGIIGLDNDKSFAEYALVDQKFGPVMPCPWLEWRTHPAGFSYAWLTGMQPGDMAVPENWTPEQSRALERFDIRDETGRMMKLADENGVETWLDLQTGRQHVGLGHREPELATEEPVRKRKPMALRRVVLAALEALELEHEEPEKGVFLARVQTDVAEYRALLLVDEEQRACSLYLRFPLAVPEDRRLAMAEMVTRANYGLSLGDFELDFSDGDLRHRACAFVADGTLHMSAVRVLLGGSVYNCDRFLPAFMQVAYGGVDPDGAIAQVEE